MPSNVFLSTLSLRRATLFKLAKGGKLLYFYPRSPCGERPRHPAIRVDLNNISIHALLAESDGAPVERMPSFSISIHALLAESDGLLAGYPELFDISIHALLAESDASTTTTTICIVVFLSTLSLRRATLTPSRMSSRLLISIHALLAESDRPLRQLQFALLYFYPRSPCGERQFVSIRAS